MTAVTESACVDRWIEAVQEAQNNGGALLLQGGGSKQFLAQERQGETLFLNEHQGVVDYQPSELVITVKSGTSLQYLREVLAQENQYFPCEPPEFDGQATVGGAVASGWAGPRRPFSGGIRDYVLGCRLISGQGKHLRFGGQVMKNVAGYDVSRLMVGSFGCLGLLTELSLKVLPKPRRSLTLRFSLDRQAALQSFIQWRRDGLPLSAVMHDGQHLFVRLEGGHSAVKQAQSTMDGDESSAEVWTQLREHSHAFFKQNGSLWRLSVPMGTYFDALPGPSLMDWAGAQWWVKASDADAQTLRAIASNVGGHATCYAPQPVEARWQQPEATVFRLNQQLKAQLDPHRVFNRGWLYPEL